LEIIIYIEFWLVKSQEKRQFGRKGIDGKTVFKWVFETVAVMAS
jgi:hypothetical protein